MSDPFLPIDPERSEITDDEELHGDSGPDVLPDQTVDGSEGELEGHPSVFRAPRAGERLTAGELETDLETES